VKEEALLSWRLDATQLLSVKVMMLDFSVDRMDAQYPGSQIAEL